MVQIMMSQTFPVTVHEAFAYITDMKNWKEYWPSFVRINDVGDARWGEPGDSVILVIRLLGREVELHMTLTDFQQDLQVCYHSYQRGLPDVQHERHWRATSAGCEYHIMVSYEPRQGLVGHFDRLVFQHSVRNAVHQTLKNLDTIFRLKVSELGEKSRPSHD